MTCIASKVTGPSPRGRITVVIGASSGAGFSLRPGRFPAVSDRFPVLVQAVLDGALAQIRNVATTCDNVITPAHAAFGAARTQRCSDSVTR